MVQEAKADSQRLHQAAEVRGRDLEDQVNSCKAATFPLQHACERASIVSDYCVATRRSTSSPRTALAGHGAYGPSSDIRVLSNSCQHQLGQLAVDAS